jgi:23S rRNA pseudouridine1911/1915/1917 synthase
MAYINHPLLGDPLYGRRFSLPKKASDELIEALRAYRHQALHAKTLTLVHPATNKEVSFEAPIPDDFQNLIRLLREHNKTAAN